MLAGGLRTRGYSMREFIDLVYVVMADDWPKGYDGRRQMDQALLASVPDRETWGTDPRAQAALRAMMAQAPPPRRKPAQPQGKPPTP